MVTTDQPPVAVRPTGELCEDTIEGLEALLRDAAGEVVVDLSEVSLVGAAGMRVLVRTRSRLAVQGGSLRVTNASPFVTRTFEVVGLDDLLS